MTKEDLLSPKFDGTGVDAFLKNLGVKLSDSKDGYPVATVRQGGKSIIYGFKDIEDYRAMVTALIDAAIPFSVLEKSTGARYEHHIALRIPNFVE